MAPKGVSNRTLLAKKKGIKMGQTISVTYREQDSFGAQTHATYRGVLADRRIGGTDRESYLEIRGCVHVGPAGDVPVAEGLRRFVDAFIDDLDVVDPQVAPLATSGGPPGAAPPGDGPGSDASPAAAAAAGPAARAAGVAMPVGMMPTGMPMGMMPMSVGMGMMPMGMAMGMVPMPMGMGMGMMPMGMPMGMGMRSMGMMAMGMSMGAGVGAMAAPTLASSTVAFVSPPPGDAPDAGACSGSGGGAGEPKDIMAIIDGIGEGEMVKVQYTHPQLGKTTYEGVLSEIYAGASHLQSYIQLTDSRRIGRQGHVRERDASKRLMCAFVDDVARLPPPPAAAAAPAGAGIGRSRSRSGRPRSRSRSPLRP